MDAIARPATQESCIGPSEFSDMELPNPISLRAVAGEPRLRQAEPAPPTAVSDRVIAVVLVGASGDAVIGEMAEIVSVLVGEAPVFAPAEAQRLPATPNGEIAEEISDAEARVLRYLPTNLTAPEIAAELYVSVHTVKTHLMHIYSKLDVHRRRDAVDRARELGLLPSSRARGTTGAAQVSAAGGGGSGPRCARRRGRQGVLELVPRADTQLGEDLV